MLSSLPIALGFISIVLLYWSASPERKPGAAVIHVVGTSFVGLALAFFEWQTIGSYALCAVVVVAAPVVAWRFARECWVAVLTPWLFSWRRVLMLSLACFVAIMALMSSVGKEEGMVMWAMYLLVLLLSPVFALKLLMWWGGIILKDLYVDSIHPQRPSEPKREGDAYLMAWWTCTRPRQRKPWRKARGRGRRLRYQQQKGSW